ncbi:SH3 domain binding glutamate rich protein Sh3beta [Arctopsyche grandis]|uniref:SH3 domain binding glutamate rich protein Sh3beta n=1 Tax=Arctopsyche grandis TaxID=121162 RepID=UPI00406D66B0
MGVKVYVSGISGNKEVKKRQQRVFMILESKNVPFVAVDITEPGKEDEKDFMQTNSTSLGCTVSDTSPRHPLPPQIFNDRDYCGDYDQFDLANEIDKLEQFLRVEVPNSNDNDESNNVIQEAQSKTQVAENELVNNVDDSVEKIETNGIASSREPSVESEKKTNGAEVAVDEEVVDDGEAAEEEADEEKNTTPSEELIRSEQEAAD